MRAGAAERFMALGRPLLRLAGWSPGLLREFLLMEDPEQQARFWKNRFDTRRLRWTLDALLSRAVLRARMERCWARHSNRSNSCPPASWCAAASPNPTPPARGTRRATTAPSCGASSRSRPRGPGDAGPDALLAGALAHGRPPGHAGFGELDGGRGRGRRARGPARRRLAPRLRGRRPFRRGRQARDWRHHRLRLRRRHGRGLRGPQPVLRGPPRPRRRPADQAPDGRGRVGLLLGRHPHRAGHRRSSSPTAAGARPPSPSPTGRSSAAGPTSSCAAPCR